MTEESRKITFLGFDFSTQRLKAVVIGEDYGILHEADVEFDNDLPEFRTSGGVVRGERGEVSAPPLLWVKALDMAMDRLVVAGVDFSSIAALSGAAQQHGSVWWSKDAEARLQSLSPDDFLHTQLATAFLCDSPVWMDSSTSEDCRALEEAVGGPEELARITGSTAYERFTGPQIRKMYRSRPRVYQATSRVSLVSSFACSLLLGKVAPIDHADGSGMNLLDITSMQWDQTALKACGDETLESKLGAPVPSPTCLGDISPYFVQRYGFKPDCKVVAFTGDNCSALAGLRLRSGWVGLSLGTSDTLLLGLGGAAAPRAGHVLAGPTPAAPRAGHVLAGPTPAAPRAGHVLAGPTPAAPRAGHVLAGPTPAAPRAGHVLAGPTPAAPRAGHVLAGPTPAAPRAGHVLAGPTPAAPRAGHVLAGPTPAAPYMALLCFANGSLTRQAHRDRLAGQSWDAFNELLRSTVRGNMGYMGIYFDTAEIVPRAAPGRWVRDAAGAAAERPAPQFEARALLEGQAIARRVHAEDMGFKLDKSSRVIATGGASVNKELLQIFADVFNTPVYVLDEHANAALLGAAIRAAEVWSSETGVKLSGSEPTVSPVATPYSDHEKIYTPMLARYKEMIKDIPKLA